MFAKFPRFLVPALGVLVFLTGATPFPVKAQQGAPPTSLIDAAFIEQVRDRMSNPVITMMIEAQNNRHAGIGQDEIDKLDKQWRAEREAEDQPLIAVTLTNPLSNYLTQVQAGSGGLYTEIFVIDDKGLNVGQSSVTSDYWQGDEAKFQKTFPLGSGAVFIDEAEYHEATGTWRAQLNMTLSNGAGQAVGAVTVEVNLTELQRLRLVKGGA